MTQYRFYWERISYEVAHTYGDDPENPPLPQEEDWYVASHGEHDETPELIKQTDVNDNE